MNLDLSQIFGIFASIVVLAIVAVAIINGDKTALIIGNSGTAFSNAIGAATHPGTSNSQGTYTPQNYGK